MSLPSARTLQDYTHYISPQTGFSKEVDEQLMAAAQSEGPEEWKKAVVIICDWALRNPSTYTHPIFQLKRCVTSE